MMTGNSQSGMPPLFTVLTPTYNRAKYLSEVYRCLQAQTYRNFEWVIVDDGSSDGTNRLVRQWQDDRLINIEYIYQENRGKHVAFNRGVALARGDMVVPLDSDDICVPDALQRFADVWLSVAEREQFSGVVCLCVNKHGEIVGDRFPAPVMDAFPARLMAERRIHGEKWGCQRTDLLRQFPYPEVAGEKFVPEGLVWDRIGRSYKMRFINEPLRIYDSLPGGLSRSIDRLRAENPRSTAVYYLERSKSALPIVDRMRAAVNYARFFLHATARAGWHLSELDLSALNLAMLPIGIAAYLIDRSRL